MDLPQKPYKLPAPSGFETLLLAEGNPEPETWATNPALCSYAKTFAQRKFVPEALLATLNIKVDFDFD